MYIQEFSREKNVDFIFRIQHYALVPNVTEKNPDKYKTISPLISVLHLH